MSQETYIIFMYISLIILVTWNIIRTLYGIYKDNWVWYFIFNMFELSIYILVLIKL